MTHEDTIAAIATPRGLGGVGIVRVSGPLAVGIGLSLFKPSRRIEGYDSHRLYRGHLTLLDGETVLDEVLFCIMRSPHSYTGEDTVEFNCHGGPLILDRVLQEIVRGGARLALPGEFTKRAYLSGHMDLAQAESVIDLINARTEKGLSLALNHLFGMVSKRIDGLRAEHLEIMALLEAAIDFSEDDMSDEISLEGISDRLITLVEELKSIIATYKEGRLHREGLSVIIFGRPNVGKSSLLNRLTGQDRAIVTPMPGTTRDFIEESVILEGLPVKFVDTAGIRKAGNVIEREGIRRVWDQVETSDIVLHVLDGSTSMSEEDTEAIRGVKSKPVITVINKSDLPQVLSLENVEKEFPRSVTIAVSAKFGYGIDDLKKVVRNHVSPVHDEATSDIMITNLRHKMALEKSCMSLLYAIDSLEKARSPEYIAYDVRESLDSLGEITGATATEEILDKIFTKFCVGK